MVLATRSPLMEIDFYMHKNNSTFFSDADISRWYLIAALLLPTLRSPPASLTGVDDRKKSLAVLMGSVGCRFHKEIKAYELFEVYTRILSWEEKWVYFESQFVRPHGNRKQSVAKFQSKPLADGQVAKQSVPKDEILATLVSKCVFKYGRKTVEPARVFEGSGLLPTSSRGETRKMTPLWSREQIEQERLRGLQMAKAILDHGHEANSVSPRRWPVYGYYKDLGA